MGHYAKVNNGIVEKVIVADQEFVDNLVDTSPGEWLKTSYNTRGGKHYNSETNEEDAGTPLRMNFASIGYTYDSTRDAFIPPQLYNSWTLNEDTCRYEAPVAYPTDGERYTWNESTTSWEPAPTE